jgi:Sulfotransferase domain
VRVIGAGLGRTGTVSLKIALEKMLGAPCYNMVNLLQHPEHVPVWEQALDGRPVDWESIFGGCGATVDYTAACFFRELATAYPSAIVVLSLRDPDEWWESNSATIFEALQSPPPDVSDPVERALLPAREFMLRLLHTRLTPDWTDETAAKEAFARHNEAVRAEIPADRLVEWRSSDGWEPVCEALGVAAPDEPFPHAWKRDEFRIRLGLDPS